MEYRFAVSAPDSDTGQGESLLVAGEYTGGRLDWYDFDQDADVKHILGSERKDFSKADEIAIPTALQFRGMPRPRYWEFEDASVDIAGLDSAPEDLPRMLLMEFGLIYGNDFFLIPLDLQVGSLCRIQSLTVRDTFNETFSVPAVQAAGSDKSWRMFCLSMIGADDQAADYLFLPPVLGPLLESSPMEEVVLTRDEMANLVWAVEQTVQGRSGHPASRSEIFQRKRQHLLDLQEEAQAGSTSPGGGPLMYRLFTETPEYWNPFSLEGSRQLRMASLNAMLGAVLAPYTGPKGILLREEEVPRVGIKVRRSFKYSRWVDGSTHCWVVRRKQPGRGEESSGLRFDVVQPSK